MNDDPLDWDDFMEVQLSNRYGSHFLAMMFRRDLIANKIPRRPDFSNREDRMFVLEVALSEPNIAYLPVNAGF